MRTITAETAFPFVGKNYVSTIIDYELSARDTDIGKYAGTEHIVFSTGTIHSFSIAMWIVEGLSANNKAGTINDIGFIEGNLEGVAEDGWILGTDLKDKEYEADSLEVVHGLFVWFIMKELIIKFKGDRNYDSILKYINRIIWIW